MDDLISRQAAIDEILKRTNCTTVRELYEYTQEHHLTEVWSGGVNEAIDAVIEVPSAQPERKKGRWINVAEDWRNQIWWWECSECGNDEAERYNYCPNCGADMRERDGRK